MFQLLTLDDWYSITKAVDPAVKFVQYWVLFTYLFTYILIEYFVFLK